MNTILKCMKMIVVLLEIILYMLAVCKVHNLQILLKIQDVKKIYYEKKRASD